MDARFSRCATTTRLQSVRRRVAYALIGLYFGTRAFIRHHATR